MISAQKRNRGYQIKEVFQAAANDQMPLKYQWTPWKTVERTDRAWMVAIVDSKSTVRNNFIETLPHIRSACSPKTELWRNAFHHRVRTSIANLFRQKKQSELYEEVNCQTVTDGNTLNRRVDIVVIERNKGCSLKLDPTIRWEVNEN